MHLGVDEQMVVGRVDPHHMTGDLPVRKVDADRPEVLGLGEFFDRGIEHVGHGTC